MNIIIIFVLIYLVFTLIKSEYNNKKLLLFNSLLDKQIDEIKINFDIYKKVSQIRIDSLNSELDKKNSESIKYQRECVFLHNIINEKEIYINHITSSSKVSNNILDAVKYAVIKSHPDNGGKDEDFIRFKKCYDELIRRT